MIWFLTISTLKPLCLCHSTLRSKWILFCFLCTSRPCMLLSLCSSSLLCLEHASKSILHWCCPANLPVSASAGRSSLISRQFLLDFSKFFIGCTAVHSDMLILMMTTMTTTMVVVMMMIVIVIMMVVCSMSFYGNQIFAYLMAVFSFSMIISRDSRVNSRFPLCHKISLNWS